MSNHPDKDQYLDEMLGRTGAAKQLRRVPKAMERALTAQGVTHKAIKAAKPGLEQAQAHANVPNLTKDPELQAKMHQAIVGHYAEKAGMTMPHDEPDGDEADSQDVPGIDPDEELPSEHEAAYMGLKEDPEGPEEADENEDLEDRMGEVEWKAQPGFEDMSETGPAQVPDIVNYAITKKPGNFQPPISHQQTSGKSIKALTKRIDDLEAQNAHMAKALGEVADVVAMLNTNKAFAPRQASLSQETAVTDESLVKSVVKMNGRFDSFWGQNIGGGQ